MTQYVQQPGLLTPTFNLFEWVLTKAVERQATGVSAHTDQSGMLNVNFEGVPIHIQAKAEPLAVALHREMPFGAIVT
jgi:hypothetical protein